MSRLPGKFKIGVLTGGGDVPGLNSCIRALTYRAIDNGHEVVGILCGWLGVASLNPDDPEGFKKWMTPLDKRGVRTVDRYGGTFLHTSRTNPICMKCNELPEHLRTVYTPEERPANPEEVFDITPPCLEGIRTA